MAVSVSEFCCAAVKARILGIPIRDVLAEEAARLRIIPNTSYQKRRQRIQAAGSVERIDRRLVFNESGGICGICRRSLTWADFSIDHILPIAKGGIHAYSNIQAAHRRCNSIKGARAHYYA